MDKCISFWGHNFEARYHSEPVSAEASLKNADTYDLKMYFDHNTKKTYVCDVCTRCGKVIRT